MNHRLASDSSVLGERQGRCVLQIPRHWASVVWCAAGCQSGVILSDGSFLVIRLLLLPVGESVLEHGQTCHLDNREKIPQSLKRRLNNVLDKPDLCARHIGTLSVALGGYWQSQFFFFVPLFPKLLHAALCPVLGNIDGLCLCPNVSCMKHDGHQNVAFVHPFIWDLPLCVNHALELLQIDKVLAHVGVQQAVDQNLADLSEVLLGKVLEDVD
mmetsp:Transcript_42654/g.106750  ORF Transcript_42654/g.106750 Transcript_42654/m.106750 type:complete len:213 (+) Transcript_42654:253-891(+)